MCVPAGFRLDNPVHQILVARYSESDLTVDFDNFVCCLVRLESMFSTYRLDRDFNSSPSALCCVTVCVTAEATREEVGEGFRTRPGTQPHGPPLASEILHNKSYRYLTF